MTEEVFVPISTAIGGLSFARKFYPRENMECVKSCSSPHSSYRTDSMPASGKKKKRWIIYDLFTQEL